MSDWKFWEDIQHSFVRNLVLKGIGYAVKEFESAVDDLSNSGWLKRAYLHFKYQKYLKKIKDIKNYCEDYQGGRCKGEAKGLEVLDPGSSIKLGTSIVSHVPDFLIWRTEKIHPQFPRCVDIAIEIKAAMWARKFIEMKGHEPLENLIISINEAASMAVQPIATKGYLAWHIYEKGFDEQSIFNEITDLFNSSGNAVYTLLAGLPLWHVGYIDGSLNVRFGRPIWTTDSYVKSGNYFGQSTQVTGAARRLHLNLIAHTLVADFYNIDLQPMQAKFGLLHPELAYFLKEWGVKNGLGGLTGTNGGWDEVVLFNPELQLEAFMVEDLVTKQVTHFNPARRLSI